MGEGREVVVFGMFDDENRPRVEEARGEYFLGYLAKTGKVIGRIGEDDVEWRRSGLDVAECVATNEVQGGVLQNIGNLADKIVLCGGFLDGGDRGASAREELEGYGSGPGKEVESGGSVKVDEVFNDVEDVLASKVGCGTSRDV